MIYASTQSEPEMMDGVCIQQLCSSRMEKTSPSWAKSLAQLFYNSHKGQSPHSVHWNDTVSQHLF